MPNLFANFVLFLWPVIVLILFKSLDRSRAIVASIVFGYLFLPNEAGFDLPLLPYFDKNLIPALSAGLMCLLLADKGAVPADTAYRMQATPPKPSSNGRRKLLITLLLVLFVAIFGTVLTNLEPLQFGRTYLPELRIYDAFSIMLVSLVMLLPFLLGWKYLSTTADHQIQLGILALAGFVYSLPALFEVRMSPQLNLWIYGFFPHSFAQHIRGGGFRPIVFLEHGLWVGIFISMATLAGAVLLRSCKVAASSSLKWSLFLIWMLITSVLIKSLGALVITILLLPIILFASGRWMVRAAAIVALIALLYPMLRGLDWVPVEDIAELAGQVEEQRATSFRTRITNENILLERAQEKPLFGWGGWGRNEVYDLETGRNIVIIDGQWIIFIGTYGWFGYIARFGILTFPLLLLMTERRDQPIPLVTCGLSLVLAANLIDLLPNATLTPVTWLIGGSLTGYVVRNRKEITREPTGLDPAPASQEPAARRTPPKNVRKPRSG